MPAIDILFVPFVACVGLAIGSFLNVVIWRVPRAESVAFPPSHCPACHAPIRPRDNVPVVSWLLLRGRCRDCGEPISRRYPIVEALTGALFAVAAALLGPSWELPAVLYLLAIGVALTFIDLDTKRLPNGITLPSYPVVLVLLLLPAALDDRWADLGRALLGGVALFAFYLVLALVYPPGMGMGDVKLAGVLGMGAAWFGWGPLIVGGFLGFLLGAMGGVALMATRRAGRKSAIPFGPYMIVGVLVGVLVGPAIFQWYVDLLAV